MNQSGSFTARQKNIFAWITYLMVPLSGVCVDIYAPSLPHVVTSFLTTPALVQLTLTTYILGFSLGQLVAGPLSDSFGRRIIMLLAASLFIAVTTLVIYSPSIHVMLILRLFQGVTLAFVIVPGRAILADCFVEEEFIQKANSMTVFWALGPIIAPGIGGFLQHYFSWQASFWFMLAYMVIILLLLLGLYQETHCNRTPFSPAILFRNYVTILQDGFFVSALIFVGILASLFVVFNVVAPFIVQNTLHYSPIVYGYIALLMGVAWFLGNTLNGKLIHLSAVSKTQFGLGVMVTVLLVMVVTALFVPLNIYLLIVPVWLLMLCGGMIFPNYIGLSLARFPHIAGSANALLFAGMWLMISVISAIATRIQISELMPLALFLCALCIASLLIFYGSLKSRLSHLD